MTELSDSIQVDEELDYDSSWDDFDDPADKWRDIFSQLSKVSGELGNKKRIKILKDNQDILSAALKKPKYLFPLLNEFGLVGEGVGYADDIEDIEELREFKASFVVKNKDVIEENLFHPNQEYESEAVIALSRYMNINYRKHTAPLADIFIRKYISGWPESVSKSLFFNYIFDVGSLEQKIGAFEDLKFQLNEDPKNQQNGSDRAEVLGYFAGILIKEVNSEVDAETIELFAKELGRFNLNNEDVMEAWFDSGPRSEFGKVIEKNLQALYTLESLRPGVGIAKTLFDEYGIASFGRYPIDMLIWQYDNRDNPNVPYGVLISSQADSNGASYNEKQAYHELFQTLNVTGMGIRIYEVSNTTKLVRALLKSNERYGDRNKISFAIISGHGNKDEIQLGKREKDKLNLKEKMSASNTRIGAHMRQIKGMFVEKPEVILISCSTGQLEGIGHEISALGARVIAPEDVTGLSSISVYRDERGGLKFSVDFTESESNVFERGSRVQED